MNIDSIDQERYEAWTSYSNHQARPESTFHTSLFCGSPYDHSFSRTAAICQHRTHVDQRVENFFLNSTGNPNVILASNVNGSVQGGFDVSWGGKEGTTFEASLSGEVKDDKGNHVEITVHQNNHGEGGANVTAGHDVKDNSSDDKSK